MDKSIGNGNGNLLQVSAAKLMMNNNLQVFMRRTLQVVISVSLLSLFLCYYSSGISLFPNSFSVYFSTCLFSIFTRSLERKYIFVICNGILVFLAKTSVSSTSSSALVEESEVLVGDRFPASDSSSKTKKAAGSPIDVAFVNADDDDEEKEKTAEEQALEYQGNESLYTSDNDGEEKTADLLMAEDQGNEEEGGWSSSMKQEEEEGMEGTEIGNEEVIASTDELNKKFEEFIRKMKEDFRIEAQQQLIAV